MQAAPPEVLSVQVPAVLTKAPDTTFLVWVQCPECTEPAYASYPDVVRCPHGAGASFQMYVERRVLGPREAPGCLATLLSWLGFGETS